ncbi:hypothetical protein JXA32_09410 [Candidatus Sumerlaeota bacterium]|nr:hypothetical protein [Candidatus Sumerlaeota bacterium]
MSTQTLADRVRIKMELLAEELHSIQQRHHDLPNPEWDWERDVFTFEDVRENPPEGWTALELRYLNFTDRFCLEENKSFGYQGMIEGMKMGFILVSAGPDGDYDLGKTELFRDGLISLKPSKAKQQLIEFTYDPTNGTISNGDIWLLQSIH